MFLKRFVLAGIQTEQAVVAGQLKVGQCGKCMDKNNSVAKY